MKSTTQAKPARKAGSPQAMPPNVEKVFAAYPPAVRRRFMRLRALVFETAADLRTAGPITETLKWGEPAYLTEQSKSGSTIRFNWKPTAPDRLAICFNCQSRLIGHFRDRFPHQFDYEGNRALVLTLGESIPAAELTECLASALQYHRIKATL